MTLQLPVEWFPSEWDDDPDSLSAWKDGITADVSPDSWEQGKWAWSVRPTSSRCEFPELYASGVEVSNEVAKRKATQALLEADKAYQHITY